MEVTDKSGRTVLASAAWNGQLEIVKFLVARGACLEAKDRWGKTVLQLAEHPKGGVNSAAVTSFLRSLEP
jgi:hypothetical protein